MLGTALTIPSPFPLAPTTHCPRKVGPSSRRHSEQAARPIPQAPHIRVRPVQDAQDLRQWRRQVGEQRRRHHQDKQRLWPLPAPDPAQGIFFTRIFNQLMFIWFAYGLSQQGLIYKVSTIKLHTLNVNKI